MDEAEAEFRARCEPWMAARLTSGTWRAWIAEHDGEIAGTAWLQLIEKIPNPSDEPEWHGYISSLYVRSDHRNQGIGTALLTACVRACDDAGVDAIFLWPTTRSRSLYRRMGFGAGEGLVQRR